MRFAKILSVAALPMFIFACGDSNSGDFSNNAKPDNPEEQPKDSIPENIPDSLLKPITRDYSSIWQHGDGTVANPYQISNEQELRSIAFYVNDSSMTFKGIFFKQTADITLSSAWTPIGIFGKNVNGFGNRPFSGTYDGGSKTISGLSITDTSAYSGLFGLTRNAHISNVVVRNAKMNVGSYAGALAGKIDSTVVENCSFEGVEIKGADRVGGLIGEATKAQISLVTLAGTVQGTSYVGGVVGSMQDGLLTNLTNSANVTGTSTVGGVVGSFAGVSSDGSVSSIFNKGAVTGTKDVGGVVATLSRSKFEKSGNYGAVTADESSMSNVGGVVAVASNKSAINEIFNTGKVTVKKVQAAGGVVGSMKAITAMNMFNHGEVSGQAFYMGGLAGIVDGDAKLESSYNAGKVPDENFAGTVAGKVASTVTITNVYYDKTVGGTCLDIANHMLGQDMRPTGLATENMITSTFATTLTASGGDWKSEPARFNGYPAFAWIQ